MMTSGPTVPQFLCCPWVPSFDEYNIVGECVWWSVPVAYCWLEEGSNVVLWSDKRPLEFYHRGVDLALVDDQSRLPILTQQLMLLACMAIHHFWFLFADTEQLMLLTRMTMTTRIFQLRFANTEQYFLAIHADDINLMEISCQ